MNESILKSQDNESTEEYRVDSAPCNLDEYQTPDQLCKTHPQFKIKNVNWWVRNRQNNGLSGAISKVNRSLLIHVPSFYGWLNSHRGL